MTGTHSKRYSCRRGFCKSTIAMLQNIQQIIPQRADSRRDPIAIDVMRVSYNASATKNDHQT